MNKKEVSLNSVYDIIEIKFSDDRFITSFQRKCDSSVHYGPQVINSSSNVPIDDKSLQLVSVKDQNVKSEDMKSSQSIISSENKEDKEDCPCNSSSCSSSSSDSNGKGYTEKAKAEMQFAEVFFKNLSYFKELKRWKPSGQLKVLTRRTTKSLVELAQKRKKRIKRRSKSVPTAIELISAI